MPAHTANCSEDTFVDIMLPVATRQPTMSRRKQSPFVKRLQRLVVWSDTDGTGTDEDDYRCDS